MADPWTVVSQTPAPPNQWEAISQEQAQSSLANPPLDSLQAYGKSVYGWKDDPKRGTILPVGGDDEGKMRLAMPQIGVDLLNSALLPGFAAKGGRYTPTDVLGFAGAATPMSPAIRGASRLAEPVAPTIKELKAAATRGYDTAQGMDITYSSASVKAMADKLENSLNAEGRIAESNPELFALIKKLQSPPEDSFAQLSGLKALRERLGDVAGSPERAKRASAKIAIDQLDEFMESGAGQSAAGALANPAASQGISDAERAAAILKEARGNSAAAFRAEELARIEDVAGLRSDAANSGRNLGNSIRQRLASILASEEQKRGFSPKELDAMREVVEGTRTTNTLRNVGNFMGGGGGLGQMLTASMGALIGGPVGAALGVGVGPLTRTIGNKLTEKQLTKVQELIAQRSPLYAERVANPETFSTQPVAADLARRLALAKALQGLPRPQPAPNPADMY
jgi:hypothetical protein